MANQPLRKTERPQRKRTETGQFASLSEEEFWREFWDQVDLSDECWDWLGQTSEFGYGIVYRDGETLWAHRLSLIYFGVDLKEDERALHKCDRRICVRPKHLYAGTQADNIRDAIERGRFRYLPPQPGELHPQHKLTEGDVLEAKLRRATGETFVSIARSFDVAPVTIRKAVLGITWRYLMKGGI